MKAGHSRQDGSGRRLDYIVTTRRVSQVLAVGLLGPLGGLGCSDSSKDPQSSADGAVDTVVIDRSGLANLGLTGALDYSDGNLWACRPGNDPNECHTNLDATEFLADGTSRVVPHARAANPPFDCFYVYPTVDIVGTGPNTTDLSDLVHVRDALYSQAARFSRICEVYAPLYRQQTLGSISATIADGGGLQSQELAYGDAKAAFLQYWEHWNHGRKVVLMGHSQGTFVMSRLITELFDGDQAMRQSLVSALLIGGGPEVPLNQDVGATFQNIRQCTRAGEVGCFIAYNAFAIEAPPPTNTVFGRSTSAANEIACTTPGPLANNTGLSKGAYMPKVYGTPSFQPDLPAGTTPAFDTPFALFPDVFRATCLRQNSFHYLEVADGMATTDQRTLAPYRSTLTETIGFGLHVADYNLVLDDLIEAVRLQAEAAL